MVARRHAAILVALLLLGCSRGGAPTVYAIDRIQISDAALAGSPLVDFSADQLRRDLIKALQDSRRFAPIGTTGKADDARPRLHCRLEVAFTRELDGAEGEGRQAEVGVALELRRAQQMERYDATGLGREAIAAGESAAPAPAFRRALEQALAQAVQSQLLQLGALEKKDAELIRDLSSPDARVREYAANVLADRRSAAAVPALIERLKDADREVALRAVGALGAIGDPRAVPALIDMSQGKDAAFVLALVDVIASIGGKDAEAWLFTVASGHADDAVRAAAQAAQERLQEKEAGAAGPAATDARRARP